MKRTCSSIKVASRQHQARRRREKSSTYMLTLSIGTFPPIGRSWMHSTSNPTLRYSSRYQGFIPALLKNTFPPLTSAPCNARIVSVKAQGFVDFDGEVTVLSNQSCKSITMQIVREFSFASRFRTLLIESV